MGSRIALSSTHKDDEITAVTVIRENNDNNNNDNGNTNDYSKRRTCQLCDRKDEKEDACDIDSEQNSKGTEEEEEEELLPFYFQCCHEEEAKTCRAKSYYCPQCSMVFVMDKMLKATNFQLFNALLKYIPYKHSFVIKTV